MKVIIAGSRTITDPLELEKAITASGITMESPITEVVCGGASGADTLGKLYAAYHNIPIKFFLPDWETFGNTAGLLRNTQMATYVGETGGLIALWDGTSPGTRDMIQKAKRFNLKVYVHLVKDEEAQ